ncbi:MAG: hypothetical protein ACRDD1_17510 [Planctomycetia bacterium]
MPDERPTEADAPKAESAYRQILRLLPHCSSAELHRLRMDVIGGVQRARLANAPQGQTGTNAIAERRGPL